MAALVSSSEYIEVLNDDEFCIKTKMLNDLRKDINTFIRLGKRNNY